MQTLLAIECSSHVNAVAYLPDIDCPDTGFGEVSREGAKASAWLLPAIDRVLAQANAHKSDVRIVAFGAGPGSFTGVRTACATAQALAYSWQVPLIAVDCLEALAEASELTQIDVALDARMNELYAASFHRSTDGKLTRLSATTLVNLSAFFVRSGAQVLGSGASLLSSRLSPLDPKVAAAATQAAEERWAYGVARVAIQQWRTGELTDPRDATPIYVRNKVALTEAERIANVHAVHTVASA